MKGRGFEGRGKKIFRAAICFSGFNMACCLFWVGFFSLLYKQYWLIEEMYPRVSQRTEFGLTEDVYLAMKFKSRASFPRLWSCLKVCTEKRLFSFLQPLYFNCQSSVLKLVFPKVGISILYMLRQSCSCKIAMWYHRMYSMWKRHLSPFMYLLYSEGE